MNGESPYNIMFGRPPPFHTYTVAHFMVVQIGPIEGGLMPCFVVSFSPIAFPCFTPSEGFVFV